MKPNFGRFQNPKSYLFSHKFVMKNNLITAVVVGLVTTLGTFSCIKSTPVGAELFKGDNLNVQFTDTVTIRCLTDKTDSIAAYIPNAPASTLFCGNTVDPTFGKQELMVFTQCVNTATPTSMVGAIYDSAVLVLPYDLNLTRVDSSETFKLDVHQLTQPMDSGQVLYSNKKYTYNPVPIGSLSFVPRLSDSTTNRIDTFKSAYVAVRLNDQFARNLVDTNRYPLYPVEAFKDIFKGLCIKANGTTKSILAFNTASTYARLHVYYHQDTNKLQLNYMLNQPVGTYVTRYTYSNQDFSNAPIAPYIKNPQKSDSLVFLQGLAGTSVQIEIPYASTSKLGKIAVNKAELEFAINDKDGYKYPVFNQLALYRISTGGAVDYITDFNTAIQSATIPGYYPYFDGTPQLINGTYLYRMNITDYFQQMLNGKQGSIMTLTGYNRTSKLNRAILYGPGTTGARRAKLKLTYTVL
ncbi:MAG: hypothetical protein RLZZ628_167 [Bacteroidota bacterium]